MARLIKALKGLVSAESVIVAINMSLVAKNASVDSFVI
jgi:hypothetical protein